MPRNPSSADGPPIVSICIASFNCQRTLEAAINSALCQSLKAIEVIVVDDGSSDDSVAIARRIARADPRVRVDVLPENRGPGGARNRGIELARGAWFAVLDSDDLYHPERLETLIAAASEAGADAVADDLVLFTDRDPASRNRFLTGARRRSASWIDPASYFDQTQMFHSKANLGFLKPVIATEFLRRNGLKYDAAMRIGEDDDLIVRCLHARMKYRLVPALTYFYRKHEGSISHRIGTGHLDQMIERAAAMKSAWAGQPLAVTAALSRRQASFLKAKAFARMIDGLKARKIGEVLGAALSRPSALMHFSMPVGARLARIAQAFKPKAAASDSDPAIAVISRQRVIGRTNGSSTYLLSLAQAARETGYPVRLIQPSPHVFGRWPVLKFKSEMAVFDRIQIRGGMRFGDYVFSTEVWRYASAARVALARALNKLKIPTGGLEGEKAIYAIGAPWTDDDRMFVARHAPARPVAVLADYAFLTEGFAYVIAPQARTAVIMHDLFHARAESLDAQSAVDGVAVLTEPAERTLLDKADAVIAIQDTEGAYVRKALPGKTVLLSPMAADPVPAAQPGTSGAILFVGSSTHPNVVGLQWLFDHVWPAVRKACPDIQLTVAGNVSRAFASAPEGARFLGVVPDLAPLYRDAAMVVSPLIVGSGLKIKLIEALAQGKAVVATTVTLQGVETLASDGVAVADTPQAFAEAMIGLNSDDAARAILADKALAVARTHFGPQACYAPLTAWLEQSAKAAV